jgi:hypothetical protein
MRSWNDLHYSRAQDFLRLIANATGPAAPASKPALVASARAESSAPAPQATPSAGAVFKKIPWKK